MVEDPNSPNPPEKQPESPESTPTPPASGSGDPIPPPPPAGGGSGGSGLDDRIACILAHGLGIVASFVGPLVIWLIKKDESKRVDAEAKEAINFQLTLLIGYVIGMVTAGICIGMLILPAVWICAVIFGIMGAVAAADNKPYRYPFRIVFIK